jgi:hypothetical protein
LSEPAPSPASSSRSEPARTATKHSKPLVLLLRRGWLHSGAPRRHETCQRSTAYAIG